ncbi:hypothetical protein OIO90_001324 [Microbotryomycetes sp. JL221]|nr:hypothetical protein OIO90_001324 [Microbotryomycetes sp. JL221]
MDNLPQEVLECIIDSLAAICIEEITAGATRNACLRSACLVSKRWIGSAQRALYRIVDIGNDAQARMFIQSDASRKWQIHDLTLSSSPSLSAEMVAAILDITPGIKTLDLNTLTTELHEAHLVCPSLSKLEILLINRPLVYMPFYEPPFPFRHLRRLVLGNRDYPPHFVQILLTISSQTLTSLTFAVGSSSPGFKALLEHFCLVAPNLRDLGLWWTPASANARYSLSVSTEESALSLMPDLSTCHELTAFRLVGYPPSMTGLATLLSNLPGKGKLKHVQTFSYHLRGEAYFELARCVRLPQLEGLKSWQHTTPSEVAITSQGFSTFVKECVKRHIRISTPY